MLSNIFARLLTSVRPINNYQQHFLRLLSTTEPISTENLSGNRETGIVKRFSKEKGYGFITKNTDGTDYFVHFKNINTTGFKTLDQGQEVEFTVVQGEKGLEAKEVSVVNTGTNRAPFIDGRSTRNNNSTSSRFGFGDSSRNRSSSSFDFGGAKSSKLHWDKQDSASNEKSFDFNSGVTSSGTDSLFSSRRTPFGGSRKRETGTIKRWNTERGFGFIRRSDGGPDLFCHARSVRDRTQQLEEGQTVEFTIQKTDKGEEARNVTLFDGEDSTDREQETPSITNPEERQTGTVKRWLPEKGYGFLQRNNGESDVFVHLRELSEGTTSLEEGQTVEFNIIQSEKGEIAQNVTVQNNS